MMKKCFLIILIGLLLISLPGCTADTKQGDNKEPIDDSVWYCDRRLNQLNTTLAAAINMKTGEVLVACPDPLCDHSASSETCFFNYLYDKTLVFSACRVDGHIYFVARKISGDGEYMKLYDYNMNSAGIEEVYTYKYIESSPKLFTNGRMLFFTAINSVGEDGSIWLYAYNPGDKTLTVLDDDAIYARGYQLAFYDDYYIHAAGSGVQGEDTESDIIRYCKRSYDGSEEEFFDTLPDGTPLEIFGYGLTNGLFAKTEANGGVFLQDENRCLPYPTDKATTMPIVYKDSFYFTTRSSQFVKLGIKVESGEPAQGYLYENEIYILNKDGTYKHYSIDCEYHFIIYAAYEDIVVGRIQYRIMDDGRYIKDNAADFIRIDLSTGEVKLYDMSLRSGFVRKTFTVDVRLNED